MHTPLPLPALAWLLIAALAFTACSTNNAKQLSVPSGDASITLLEFARQAEVEIIFDANSVSGIRTQAIDGKHPPAEALDLMTLDTPLRVNQDLYTGAFAITRKT